MTTLTTDMLGQWFGMFNRQYFESTLPRPVFRLSKARTRLGTMQCVKRPGGLLSKPVRTFTISVSTYYKSTERDYQTVLLHEMIHYYICFHGLKDTSPHGTLFRRMMEQINSHGWHITVSTNTTGRETSMPPRRRKHLLLVVKTTGGERFISSVAIGAAWGLHGRLAHARGQIADEQWYVSSDQRFDSFTRVRSLRGHKIESDRELDDFLAVMQHVDTQELFSGHYRL